MGSEDDSRTLGALIDQQIRLDGPMSIATYMGLCLGHPRLGYYAVGRPIGAHGDFITAPEISQMFGELIGFFVVNLWQQMDEPRSFTLLELGPGRGTLTADLLRAATRAPGFADALHLQLFDSSGELRAEQQKRLGDYNPYWADEIDAVADDPLFVVANEFFDALPIRQYVKRPDGWHERLVGLAGDKRTFGLSPTPIADEAMPEAVRGADDGAVYEAATAGAQVVARLAAKVARNGGAILAIDYGYDRTQTGETLQAVRRHAFADPLDAPGETDLSAHVDFDVLAQVAAGAGLAVQPVTPQGEFLARLGIIERAKMLKAANPGSAAEIERALHRLTLPEHMGQLFKVLCATSPGLKPAGFAS